MEKPKLSNREQQILRSIINLHVKDGSPIGSKAIASLPAINLSSASVRNIMADLEDLGLIHSPHTSAGRIPTTLGYRLFVDSLITTQPIEQKLLKTINQSLDSNKSAKSVIKSASNLVSGLTKMAGIVTVPKKNSLILRQVEFLPLTDHKILVILVLNQSEVQNRVITTTRTYTPSELVMMGNYITDKFAGKSLPQVRQSLINAMKKDKSQIDKLMHSMLDIADKTFNLADKDEDAYFVAGHENLLNIADKNDIDKLKLLFNAFTQKQDILHLLDECLIAEDVKIYIGEESGLSVLDNYSIITAPYKTCDESIGIIGVVGPTRMAYDKVIPIVDITAKLISTLLNFEN